MHVDIEPISGILRVFAEDKQYGDKYVWACTVKYVDAHTIELMGVIEAPTPSICRAFVKHFRQNNYKHIIITRMKAGERIDRVVNI